ncbi:hypothetical protein JCM21142_41510 [Saccharicrinis fermentans DSM 9555 = JCM 21142]|uniref:Uncharacterized protein n=1 Tax=Saccharicrinis fermentans DSM 9555 = JCM 21142 TaxID=869213 RepID=W7Y5L5_9BACT|nr:hypothetical protein JCM21142_41510 [Saccharicrinis fermentans DSM 9555 = JCM 21142]
MQEYNVPQNLLKQNCINKLYVLYDFDRVDNRIVNPTCLINIHQFLLAIKYKFKEFLVICQQQVAKITCARSFGFYQQL